MAPSSNLQAGSPEHREPLHADRLATRRPATGPRPSSAHLADPGLRHRCAPGRQRPAHPRDVGPPWWRLPAEQPCGDPDRDRPGHRAARHLLRAHPARADVAEPVARPGLRDGSPRVGAPVARLRHGLADRGARRLHDGRLVAGRRPERPRRDDDPARDIPVRADGNRGDGLLRRGRGHLGSRRPAATLLRDVARDPLLRLPGDRARIRARAGGRERLHQRPDRPDLLDGAPGRGGGHDPRLPLRAADRDDAPASPPGRTRRDRGAGRGLSPRDRPRHGSARGPQRPVLQPPHPDP